jgi:hypothetical protein
MSRELPRELIALTRTRQLLSEAKTVQDLKGIRNKAEAARGYAKSAQLGLEIQIAAAEVKLECERRAGAMIREIEFSPGGRPRGKNRSPPATSLKELGINKSQSSRWQQEAELPEEDFQRYLTESRACHREPTSQGLLRLIKLQKDGQCCQLIRSRNKRRDSHSDGPVSLESSIQPGLLSNSSEENAIIADLQNHHKQLSSLLTDFCDVSGTDKSEQAPRRYVARLLSEMGDFLRRLRALRQVDNRNRASA